MPMSYTSKKPSSSTMLMTGNTVVSESLTVRKQTLRRAQESQHHRCILHQQLQKEGQLYNPCDNINT